MSKVLYLGDTTLKTAASYLAAVMTHYKIDFDYIPSDTAFDSRLLDNNYSAVIISDYPSSNFTNEQISRLVSKIKGGVGLLMLGGWESFTGLGGGYNKTEIADVLPVELSNTDDRFNSANACVIKKQCKHIICDKLPFDAYSPLISGFNMFKAKKDSLIVLSSLVYQVSVQNGQVDFVQQKTHPLLVVSSCGNSNIAAYASDAAPHWVGGFVDWGDRRIDIQADGGEKLEVGNWYAEFFANLIKWSCNGYK